MKIEDYMMLKKAGYSDEEISAYNSSAETETAVSEPEIKPEPVKEEPQQKADVNERMYTALLDEVKALRGQMEKYFINRDSMNISSSSEDIAQKILASVINPPTKK